MKRILLSFGLLLCLLLNIPAAAANAAPPRISGNPTVEDPLIKYDEKGRPVYEYFYDHNCLVAASYRDGVLSEVCKWDGQELLYRTVFDKDGRKLQHDIHRACKDPSVVYKYFYDGHGNMVRREVYTSQEDGMIMSYIYAYDFDDRDNMVRFRTCFRNDLWDSESGDSRAKEPDLFSVAACLSYEPDPQPIKQDSPVTYTELMAILYPRRNFKSYMVVGSQNCYESSDAPYDSTIEFYEYDKDGFCSGVSVYACDRNGRRHGDPLSCRLYHPAYGNLVDVYDQKQHNENEKKCVYDAEGRLIKDCYDCIIGYTEDGELAYCYSVKGPVDFYRMADGRHVYCSVNDYGVDRIEEYTAPNRMPFLFLYPLP